MISLGQKVRVRHTDATGAIKVYNGAVVKQIGKEWSVNIGAIAITFTEENIHAIKPSDAQVEGGQAAIGQQVGSKG